MKITHRLFLLLWLLCALAIAGAAESRGKALRRADAEMRNANFEQAEKIYRELLAKDEAEDKPEETKADETTVIAVIKDALGDRVSDVKASQRLTASASCLVAGGFGPDRELEKLLARANKGAGSKPVLEINLSHPLVAALEAVSLVTWFEDDTPLALIRLVLPDILVKGGDWSTENIVGAADVKARGGSVHSIPFIHDRSTTATLRRIRG